ncbi:MAG: alpha/beta hydrolase [Acidobacteriota bacterium]|nr:alpha/beta hydrolase [Acidobacteriota bacterium]
MTIINIKNVPLNYREAGNINNHTIVFAHPVLWGAEMFDSIISELAKDFHVVAVDIHGHGKSGYRDSLTLDDMTDDFYRLIEKLDLPGVTWFGYSIGGMLGMRLALAHPEKVDSLILMATTARLDAPEIKAQTLQLWEMFRDGHRADIAEPALQFFFARKTFENQPELVEHYRNKIVNFKEVGGMFEAALAAFERKDIGDKIGAINIPTLVIAGKEDVSASPKEAEFIASRIPNSQLEILEDANHLVAVEKPREVLKIIRAFLKRVEFSR